MTLVPDSWGPPKVLLDALDAVPCFEEPVLLHECARQVGRALRIRIVLPDTSRRRIALMFLLREVMAHPDGLRVLGGVVSMLEGETRDMARLRTAIALAEVPLFPAPTWERLMTLLGGLEVLDIAGVFHEALGDRPDPLPAHCAEPWSAVLYAATLNARPGRALPCVLLVEELARYARGGQRQELLDWAAEHRQLPEAYPGGSAPGHGGAPNLPAVAAGEGARPAVRSDRDFARPVSAVPPMSLPGVDKETVWSPATWLMVRLRPLLYSDRAHTQQLTYWYRNGSSPAPYPVKGGDLEIDVVDLPERVKSLVQEAETGWAYLCRDDLALEFVLPKSLMHLPVESWAKEGFGGAEATLGKDHPVVLRSLERVEGRATHGRWAKRWDTLKPGCRGPVHWFPGEHPDRLLADPHPVMVVLSGPPGSRGTMDSGIDELDVSLRAGVPIVVWDRRGGIDPAFRHELLEIAARTGVHRLPEVVRALRIGAGDGDPAGGGSSALGHHAALLWDDPYRLPGGPGEAAESSAQGGG
ncbi:hypothetical protein ABZW47_12605 [Streptomyces sp. NPDC004549]|uniref:VMAP-C domain-containing protein n=1 Tax=Streptomyces sp. NPDC004549 TaxID=3154283 RepID=UPI0033B626D4